jgi:hypothetical protein
MQPAHTRGRDRRVDLGATAGLPLCTVGEWRLLMKGAVRPMRVVVLDVLVKHLDQVAWSG